MRGGGNLGVPFLITLESGAHLKSGELCCSRHNLLVRVNDFGTDSVRDKQKMNTH